MGAVQLAVVRARLASPYWSLVTAGGLLVSGSAFIHEQNGWLFARSAFLHHLIGWTMVIAVVFPLGAAFRPLAGVGLRLRRDLDQGGGDALLRSRHRPDLRAPVRVRERVLRPVRRALLVVASASACSAERGRGARHPHARDSGRAGPRRGPADLDRALLRPVGRRACGRDRGHGRQRPSGLRRGHSGATRNRDPGPGLGARTGGVHRPLARDLRGRARGDRRLSPSASASEPLPPTEASGCASAMNWRDVARWALFASLARPSSASSASACSSCRGWSTCGSSVASTSSGRSAPSPPSTPGLPASSSAPRTRSGPRCRPPLRRPLAVRRFDEVRHRSPRHDARLRRLPHDPRGRVGPRQPGAPVARVPPRTGARLGHLALGPPGDRAERVPRWPGRRLGASRHRDAVGRRRADARGRRGRSPPTCGAPAFLRFSRSRSASSRCS